MVQKTSQVEIAKIYAKTFDTALLIMLQNFWKNSYENLNVNFFKIFLIKFLVYGIN